MTIKATIAIQKTLLIHTPPWEIEDTLGSNTAGHPVS
jgi:hypothetical protein